jgi:N6-L-threonylcarbamoyladenine synthase
MLVLGIETSCDETCAAVVDESGRVLSDVVHSQVELHAPYGGVVPELASRDHLRNVRPVVEAALSRAPASLDAIHGIAVTCRPGLSGALLVGVELAQALAFARELPIVGVDHLVGHLLAVFLRYGD